MKPLITLREALSDPQLLGNAIPGPSWALWRALLIAAVGERLDDEESALLGSVTGRDVEPGQPVEEMWAVLGRRSGKTRAAAVWGAYIAALCDHADVLAPGERGVLPILAMSTLQASRAFNHILGVLASSPVLSAEIQGEPTADTIRLPTVDIEVRAASFRTIRGVTAIGAICDELAFWHVDGAANPDTEILNALHPALATTGGPLIVISSPYARKGELFETYNKHFGPQGDPLILVANAPSRTFNPTLKQSVIDRAYAKDPASAAAEYGGQFRSDVESFVSREAVGACVDFGCYERLRVSGQIYYGFLDAAGGSGGDSMTAAVAHNEGGTIILDAIRERRPPFSPNDVVAEFADLFKSYGLGRATADKWGSQLIVEAFGKCAERKAEVRSILRSAAIDQQREGPTARQ